MVVELVYPGAVKMPKAYEVDFAVMRSGRVVGVVEVKVRSRHYPEIILSLHKAQALRRFAAWGLHARLIVATPEGVFLHRVTSEVTPITLGGRTDRGDPDDVEPVVRYPVAGMRRVCDAPAGLFAPQRGERLGSAW